MIYHVDDDKYISTIKVSYMSYIIMCCVVLQYMLYADVS